MMYMTCMLLRHHVCVTAIRGGVVMCMGWSVVGRLGGVDEGARGAQSLHPPAHVIDRQTATGCELGEAL